MMAAVIMAMAAVMGLALSMIVVAVIGIAAGSGGFAGHAIGTAARGAGTPASPALVARVCLFHDRHEARHGPAQACDDGPEAPLPTGIGRRRGRAPRESGEAPREDQRIMRYAM